MGAKPVGASRARILSNVITVCVALFCLFVSVVVLLYFYAFLSMVDPALRGMDRWREIFRKMFLGTEGFVTWPMLLIFVLSIFTLLRVAYRITFSRGGGE